MESLCAVRETHAPAKAHASTDVCTATYATLATDWPFSYGVRVRPRMHAFCRLASRVPQMVGRRTAKTCAASELAASGKFPAPMGGLI